MPVDLGGRMMVNPRPDRPEPRGRAVAEGESIAIPRELYKAGLAGFLLVTCVVIPGTFAGGHQEENAALLVEEGAAVRLADDELTSESLLRTLDSLDSEQLRRMAEASAQLGRPDAARRVVRVLREVTG